MVEAYLLIFKAVLEKYEQFVYEVKEETVERVREFVEGDVRGVVGPAWMVMRAVCGKKQWRQRVGGLVMGYLQRAEWVK